MVGEVVSVGVANAFAQTSCSGRGAAKGVRLEGWHIEVDWLPFGRS